MLKYFISIYFNMKYIEINVIQFILIIIFIFFFTYLWIPKRNIYETPEYKNLNDKYNEIVNEKNYWQTLYTNMPIPKINTNNLTHSENQIGSKTSAHSSAITPRNIDSNDAELINQFFY